MKFINILKWFFAILGVTIYWTVFATVDHFEVILGDESIEIWKYTDLEIKAIDKNNNVITDFVGEIVVFSESDLNVELPGDIVENLYEFKPTDKWAVRFENAVKFSSTGIHDMSVYDANDTNILGITEIEVTEVKEPEVLEISLNSPENNSVTGENSVIVSWVTDKNRNVQIFLNNSEKFETQSNGEWNFNYEIKPLKDGKYSISAKVLNADWEVAWESNEINISADITAPVIDSFTIAPSEVEEWTEITFEVISETNLAKAQIIFNDSVVSLTESNDNPWTYKWIIVAPSLDWKLDAKAQVYDDFWHLTEEIKTEAVTVSKKPEPVIVEEPEVVEEEVIEETPEPVIVEEPEVVEKEETKELWVVKWLRVTKMKDKSVITWDITEWAEEYNIYKKDKETGERLLIETISDNKYIVHISDSEEVIYENFSIKAVAKDTNGQTIESPEFSEMVQVQTWPAEILLLLVFSMVIGYMILRRRNA